MVKKVWRTDRQTDRRTDGLNQSYSCLVAAKNLQHEVTFRAFVKKIVFYCPYTTKSQIGEGFYSHLRFGGRVGELFNHHFRNVSDALVKPLLHLEYEWVITSRSITIDVITYPCSGFTETELIRPVFSVNLEMYWCSNKLFWIELIWLQEVLQLYNNKVEISFHIVGMIKRLIGNKHCRHQTHLIINFQSNKRNVSRIVMNCFPQ